MHNRITDFFGFKHSKEKLFLRKEYTALLGKKRSVLILLAATIFLSLASIGLGRAGLDYLDFKMNDPFIKWFSINVSGKHSGDYSDIKKFLETSLEDDKYGIEAVSGSYRNYWSFYRKESNGAIFVFVQGFDYWRDSLFLESILAEENLVKTYVEGYPNAESFRQGVIVTELFLSRLEVTLKDLETKRIVVEQFDNLSLDVVAVVKSLPNKSDLMSLNSFIYTVGHPTKNNVSEPNVQKQKEIVVAFRADDSNDKERFKKGLEKELKNKGLNWVSIEKVSVPRPNIAHSDAFKIQLTEYITSGLKRDIQYELNKVYYKFNPSINFEWNLPTPSKRDSERYGNMGFNDKNRDMMYDRLSFKIDLDSIDSFQQKALEDFQIELDMDQAEAKKNYGVVTFLTIFLIIALVIFAAFAILIYLYNLVKNHLNQIRMNLGTFLAFGMSKKFLIRGYLFIVFRLMLTAAIYAFGILFVFEIVLSLIPDSAFSTKLDFLKYFSSLGNVWLWLTMLVIFTLSYCLFYRQLSRFLSYPPGDLIYGRK